MKDFFVLPVPASTLFTIALEGGGEIPHVLKGHYTSPAYAKRDIHTYLLSKDVEQPEEIRVAHENKTIPKSAKTLSLNKE